MVCAAMRRDFGSSSLSHMAPGAQLWFQAPPLYVSHLPVSAPRLPEHMSPPRQEAAEVVIGASGPPRRKGSEEAAARQAACETAPAGALPSV